MLAMMTMIGIKLNQHSLKFKLITWHSHSKAICIVVLVLRVVRTRGVKSAVV